MNLNSIMNMKQIHIFSYFNLNIPELNQIFETLVPQISEVLKTSEILPQIRFPKSLRLRKSKYFLFHFHVLKCIQLLS